LALSLLHLHLNPKIAVFLNSTKLLELLTHSNKEPELTSNFFQQDGIGDDDPVSLGFVSAEMMGKEEGRRIIE
jgi:hypothetical protein